MKIIKTIGIVIFTFLSIFEFSGFIEYLSEQLLFLSFPGSLSILWVPELIGLTIYLYLLKWAVKKSININLLSSGKILNASIIVFFVLLLVKFLYSFYGTGILYMRFPEAFDAFHKLRDEKTDLQRIMAFIPTFKYLILVLILYLNLKMNSIKTPAA